MHTSGGSLLGNESGVLGCPPSRYRALERVHRAVCDVVAACCQRGRRTLRPGRTGRSGRPGGAGNADEVVIRGRTRCAGGVIHSGLIQRAVVEQHGTAEIGEAGGEGSHSFQAGAGRADGAGGASGTSGALGTGRAGGTHRTSHTHFALNALEALWPLRSLRTMGTLRAGSALGNHKVEDRILRSAAVGDLCFGARAPVMVVPMVMVSGQTGVQGQPGIPQQELPQFWQELPQS